MRVVMTRCEVGEEYGSVAQVKANVSHAGYGEFLVGHRICDWIPTTTVALQRSRR